MSALEPIIPKAKNGSGPKYDPSVLRRKREAERLTDLEQRICIVIAGVPSSCLVLGKTVIVGNDGISFEYRRKPV